jgi:hypothetical protein
MDVYIRTLDLDVITFEEDRQRLHDRTLTDVILSNDGGQGTDTDFGTLAVPSKILNDYLGQPHSSPSEASGY